MNATNSLPNLPSVKEFPGNLMFQVVSKNGEAMIRMWDTGRIEAMHGARTNYDEAAKSFLSAVTKNLNLPEPLAIRRDLSFLITFIQSKGVIFCNPQEKLELSSWIGEISRRYNLEV